jgi:hypothetical protein
LVVTTATVELLDGGGAVLGVVAVVFGIAVVDGSTLTVVLCTILVFPSIVVAVVTVAVGTNVATPPFCGSQTPPPSWACTVGKESNQAMIVAGGVDPGCWISEEGRINDGQIVGYSRGAEVVAHVLSAVIGITVAKLMEVYATYVVGYVLEFY